MTIKLYISIVLFLFGQVLSAQNKPVPPLDSRTQKVVLDNICKAINEYYVFPDRAASMSEYIKQQSEKGAYDSLLNPHDLADKIVRDIRSLYNDIHIRVEYNPNLEKDIITFTTSKAGAGKVSDVDIARDEQQNFYFKKIEILPSNIGYIEFTNFATPSPSARKTVRAAMQFISHADALILDMRNNYGGNGVMANEILSYFFAAKTYIGKSFNRITNTWSDNYIENKKAITGGVVLKMPVYILTSNRTFSAAEAVAYTLRHIKQDVVVIGDTTRGGAHLTRSFSLGHGFVGFIPYMRGENVTTKTDWEGTGVIPDSTVDEKNCLQTAQNVILHKKLSATTDETAKRKVNWLLNYYKSKNSSLGVNSSDAIKFTGNFAEFEITCKDNQLMCRDTNQPHSTPEQLIPITSTLFQVGATYQIECIVDDSGSCDTIKMYWDDGWVESIPRTK